MQRVPDEKTDPMRYVSAFGWVLLWSSAVVMVLAFLGVL